VNLGRLQAARAASWDELERLVGEARGRPERLGPARLRRLGALYRAAAGDLAAVRRAHPGDPVARRLEDVVERARILVYDAAPERGSLRDFVVTGYWRRVAERPVPVVLAALLLLAPALLAGAWALGDPAAAGGLVPEPFRGAAEPGRRGTDLGLSPAERAAFSSQVLTNNVQVTFMAWGAGLALALGTAAVLVYNGLILGAIGGLTVGAGHGAFFVELVAAHGVLELSCVVVAGAAGLRLGWALVEPGRLKRTEALVREGRRSVDIVLGTAPWLVVAGVIEGFVSRQGRAAVPMAVVGLLVGALYWGLVLWRGRRPPGLPADVAGTSPVAQRVAGPAAR
jgi:uncharacterized membrane protein SpoIIM required for sporulation